MKKKLKVINVDGKLIVQVEGVPEWSPDDDELDELIDLAMKNIEEGTMIKELMQEEA